MSSIICLIRYQKMCHIYFENINWLLLSMPKIHNSYSINVRTPASLANTRTAAPENSPLLIWICSSDHMGDIVGIHKPVPSSKFPLTPILSPQNNKFWSMIGGTIASQFSIMWKELGSSTASVIIVVVFAAAAAVVNYYHYFLCICVCACTQGYVHALVHALEDNLWKLLLLFFYYHVGSKD